MPSIDCKRVLQVLSLRQVHQNCIGQIQSLIGESLKYLADAFDVVGPNVEQSQFAGADAIQQSQHCRRLIS